MYAPLLALCKLLCCSYSLFGGSKFDYLGLGILELVFFFWANFPIVRVVLVPIGTIVEALWSVGPLIM